MLLKKTVFCTLKIDGIHNWENIPDTEELRDVQFLKLPHRHLFGIKAFKYVNHSDRDIEFIHLKRDILDYLHSKYYDFKNRSHVLGSMSCEMLAEELINEFDLHRCEVDEDGENGSVVVVV